MFVYQPTLNMPELETEKGTDHIGWKSKGVYNSELVTLHGAFLPNKIFDKKNRNAIQ